MEMYLRMYGMSLATYCIMLFMLYKLYIFMLPRLNNTSTWKLEIYYRQLMRFRHEHGIQVWPDVHDNWLYAEVSIQAYVCIVFLQNNSTIQTFYALKCCSEQPTVQSCTPRLTEWRYSQAWTLSRVLLLGLCQRTILILHRILL